MGLHSSPARQIWFVYANPASETSSWYGEGGFFLSMHLFPGLDHFLHRFVFRDSVESAQLRGRGGVAGHVADELGIILCKSIALVMRSCITSHFFQVNQHSKFYLSRWGNLQCIYTSTILLQCISICAQQHAALEYGRTLKRYSLNCSIHLWRKNSRQQWNKGHACSSRVAHLAQI